MSKNKTSVESIAEASRNRAKFSGHGEALGAAGHCEVSYDPDNSAYLREPGQSFAVDPGPNGFEMIGIGTAWDPVLTAETNPFKKLFRKTRKSHVDLDIGCFYEMQDGTRGCVQAFGEKFGNYNAPPFIVLSGDERSGEAKGIDEHLLVNGAYWNKIKRILVYMYIYEGAPNWAKINPRVIVDIPGEEDMVVTLGAKNDTLAVCAIAGLENVRGGVKLTNHTEYFPGHAEMDRAFGFGLPWADGKK
jgi:tellurite resistance protein TerA